MTNYLLVHHIYPMAGFTLHPTPEILQKQRELALAYNTPVIWGTDYHPDGRTSGASHLMIDYFIQEHAGQDLILDFEGSSISSLAFFYKSFGGQLEKFAGIKLNRLPAISKLFGK